MDEVQLSAHMDIGEAAVKYGSEGTPYLQLQQWKVFVCVYVCVGASTYMYMYSTMSSELTDCTHSACTNQFRVCVLI